MLLESLSPLPLKSRVLYSGSPVADGIATFEIPMNSVRHSLVINSNATFNLLNNKTTTIVVNTSLSTACQGVMKYDDWGDFVQQGFIASGIGALTSLLIIDVSREIQVPTP